MRWLRSIFKKSPDIELDLVQKKFKYFRDLLQSNNNVLQHISDIEEKIHGEYLFDQNYVKSALSELRKGINEIITNMIFLGGDKYKRLQQSFHEIDNRIAKILPGGRIIEEDKFTYAISELTRDRSLSVGGKIAHLGEMKSKLNMPIPDGFAITAWAYKHFIDSNNLQEKINKLIKSLDIKSYEDLLKTSNDIRELVIKAVIPDDLSQTITRSYESLHEKEPETRFALRSSALGEDSEFSFAGQYRSVLNVDPHKLLESYREILASKFTPQAIYYFLSHSLSEDELAMCVGCIAMINSQSSGVIYTRDPVNLSNDNVARVAVSSSDIDTGRETN